MTKIRLILIIFLLLLVMLMGALYWQQDRLLDHQEPIESTYALVVAKSMHLAPWPDAAAPRGWLRETASTTRGTIMIFHDNPGHALHLGGYADVLKKLGYRTLLVEYPGYGHRPGATDEATLSADAAEAIAAVRKSFDGKLIVIGEGLGAGVASAAVGHGNSGVGAVMLITPWDKLAGMVTQHYPPLPNFLVLGKRYDSVANLKGFKGPKLVLVAGRDSVIPAELGQNLFRALDENKKLMVMPDSDHTNWRNQMTSATLQEVMRFLEGN